MEQENWGEYLRKIRNGNKKALKVCCCCFLFSSYFPMCPYPPSSIYISWKRRQSRGSWRWNPDKFIGWTHQNLSGSSRVERHKRIATNTYFLVFVFAFNHIHSFTYSAVSISTLSLFRLQLLVDKCQHFLLKTHKSNNSTHRIETFKSRFMFWLYFMLFEMII